MKVFNLPQKLIALLPRQTALSEEERKGNIFNYFLIILFVPTAFLTLIALYTALVFEGEAAQESVQFLLLDTTVLILLGLIWLGHRRYPNIMRHILIGTVSAIIIFVFDLDTLNQSAISLVVPILMVAFLTKAHFSGIYFVVLTSLYILRNELNGYTFVENSQIAINVTALFSTTFIAWLIAASLDKAITDLRSLNTELDQRVQDRTKELSSTLAREQRLASRNQTILQSIADGILVFDAKNQILMANPAAKQLAGRELEAVHQSDLFEPLTMEARDSLQASLNGSPPKDGGYIRFEWHERALSANIAPVVLQPEQGEAIDIGSVMVLRDYTREAELERAKDMFLSVVSHELRTPMTAVQGYVEVIMALEEDHLTAESAEYLNTINTSVKQLLALTNELIDLSRLETDELNLYCQWVSVETLVNEAAQMVRQEFTNRNLQLETIIEPNMPDIFVDGRRIIQVLLNLLSNAYKYTKQGGATVNASRSEQWIEVSVTDTGLGIKPGDQERLFQRFFRSSDQDIQKAGGTGLGLSISKSLSELHGGSLTFQSEYGKGTTFLVKLPKNSAT
ncbi:MAG: ATP-binding protein [Chloroflexota bacterium]